MVVPIKEHEVRPSQGHPILANVAARISPDRWHYDSIQPTEEVVIIKSHFLIIAITTIMHDENITTYLHIVTYESLVQ